MFQTNDDWTSIDELENKVATVVCCHCMLSDDDKDCSNCEPFSSVKMALNQAIIDLRAGGN